MVKARTRDQVQVSAATCHPNSMIWYWDKLGSKQAHRATHWPNMGPWSCSFGWCVAEGRGNGYISAHSVDHVARK